MAHGDFVWTDLSAHDLNTAKSFYGGLMGWDWLEDSAGTLFAIRGEEQVASLFQMPAKFENMGMPLFWMSYIGVDSVVESSQLAEQLGGKVEIKPQNKAFGDKFALIRDPLGAGFSILEGSTKDIQTDAIGARLGHSLFVSDVDAVMHFYEGLFGWTFGRSNGGVIPVSFRGKTHFYCHEIPDPNIRGKEQYWTVFFRPKAPAKSITLNGGIIEGEVHLPEGRAVFAKDPQGAAFAIIERETDPVEKYQIYAMGMANFALFVFLVFQVQWAFWIVVSVLIVLSTIPALVTGKTRLLGKTVTRMDQPVKYWLSVLHVLVWAAFGVFTMLGGALR